MGDVQIIYCYLVLIMNNQTLYWVWIQQALGYANNKITSIMSRYTFAEDFYRASLADKLSCVAFTANEANALGELSLRNAEATLKRCIECGIDAVSIGDSTYPERLLNIPSPPVVLYVKGNTELLSSELSVAVVGTRSATPYGQSAATKFGFDLAKRGVTVVSGGAMGVDSCSHKGAITAGGNTVCVLGCGIEYRYLMQNKQMRDTIAKTGLLVSEYPPDYPPTRYTFPARNRIISGLSMGVLVVEAGVRSGSLITANIALEQNRDVFAVPGSIASDVSYGTNKLIKLGAKAVTEVNDILEEYVLNTEFFSDTVPKGGEQVYSQLELTLLNCTQESDGEGSSNISTQSTDNVNKEKKKVKKLKDSEKKSINTVSGITAKNKDYIESIEKEKIKLECLTDEELKCLSQSAQAVLELFKNERELHIDAITERLSIPVSKVHAAMTELEMNDIVELLAGRMYRAV